MKSKLIAEFLGTFILVFAGTGAVMADRFTGGAVSHTGIALVFGMVVIAMIYSIGEISGAHINPAVTLGFAVSGRFAWREVLPYIMVQLLGAVLAPALWSTLLPEEREFGATLPAVGLWQGWLLEMVLTFILMFVIIHVATGSREQGIMAGMAIGLTVAMEALFAGPFTGASMNPARSFGPALFAGGEALSLLWLYVSAPVAGALLAIMVFRVMRPGAGKSEGN